MNTNKPTIIWDWNGTLLNDTSICIKAMNNLLSARNLELLTTHSYRKIFTFPVKDYYTTAGFNFSIEPFEKPAMEFIEEYQLLLPSAELFTDVKQILASLKNEGYSLMILSAMEEESLIKSVSNLGIANYFDTIVGINDIYAHSKIERGKQVIENLQLNIDNALLIGDTLHDKEVADELGCKCIIIANGHQSNERLKINGNIVTTTLFEAKELINKLLPITKK